MKKKEIITNQVTKINEILQTLERNFDIKNEISE